jgi:hypothetical protein
MSDPALLVAFRRAGGRAPADDERLDIQPDGRYEARRTVAGVRIGRFAGMLEGDALAELEARTRSAAAAGDVTVPTPMDGATVSVAVGDTQAQTGSNEILAGPWGELVTALTALLDGPLLAGPVAALELEATAAQARLRHVGSEPLEVDTSSVRVRAVRLDAEGMVLGRWQGSAAHPEVEDAAPTEQATWVTANEGWQLELPFRHGLELTSEDWLQVWVMLSIRDHGERRAGRLFVAVSGAGG